MIAVFTRKLERAGAIVLALGAAAFVAVYVYLQSTFGYPDVLERGAADVLPALAAGGSSLRVAWMIYAALPLTLLVAGIASMPLLEDGGGRGLARLGATSAGLAAFAMIVGLVRWPTLHDTLAAQWATASIDQRSIYATLFDAANLYLGNVFGELVGEVALAGWFACIGVALRRTEQPRAGTLSLAAAAIVALGALRLFTTAVGPFAAAGNIVLPLWLFVIAAWLWRRCSSGFRTP